MLVKHLLETKSYGFALPKNSELTTNLSVNILNVRWSSLVYVSLLDYHYQGLRAVLNCVPSSTAINHIAV
jgi:hypothetical protein